MIASRLLPFALIILCTAGPLAAQELARSLNPLAALDQASIMAFVEQPLFEPSRRPPVVRAALRLRQLIGAHSRREAALAPPSGLVESTRSSSRSSTATTLARPRRYAPGIVLVAG